MGLTTICPGLINTNILVGHRFHARAGVGGAGPPRTVGAMFECAGTDRRRWPPPSFRRFAEQGRPPMTPEAYLLYGTSKKVMPPALQVRPAAEWCNGKGHRPIPPAVVLVVESPWTLFVCIGLAACSAASFGPVSFRGALPSPWRSAIRAALPPIIEPDTSSATWSASPPGRLRRHPHRVAAGRRLIAGRARWPDRDCSSDEPWDSTPEPSPGRSPGQAPPQPHSARSSSTRRRGEILPQPAIGYAVAYRSLCSASLRAAI